LFDLTKFVWEDKIPTLLLHGIEDEMIPYAIAEFSYEKIKHWKNVKFIGYENLGHNVNQ
jgi:dipeptidyl aminopeptidase/acylaminoacyl peptidase